MVLSTRLSDPSIISSHSSYGMLTLISSSSSSLKTQWQLWSPLSVCCSPPTPHRSRIIRVLALAARISNPAASITLISNFACDVVAQPFFILWLQCAFLSTSFATLIAPHLQPWPISHFFHWLLATLLMIFLRTIARARLCHWNSPEKLKTKYFTSQILSHFWSFFFNYFEKSEEKTFQILLAIQLNFFQNLITFISHQKLLFT